MSLDRLGSTSGGDTMGGLRPCVMGTRHMIAAGHYLAAQAGFEILEGGGNAIDAGVAACIVMAVVQSDFVNVAGVAPMMIHLAENDVVETISGLGCWPRGATTDFFVRHCAGEIPDGILRTVVPAAPAAWIEALRRFGTASFGDVASPAIRFARDGFVMYPLMAEMISENADKYRRWPSNAEIYLPSGRPPTVGEVFRQSDLGRTLQYLVDAERALAGKGRESGLCAVADAFYRGDVADVICRYHAQEGGLLTWQDLADFRVEVEQALSVEVGEHRVYSCNAWSQGPVLLQTLRLLGTSNLSELSHNSTDYIHRLVESIKLCFADREAHYGDPRFVSPPLEELLSNEYAKTRSRLIDPGRAAPAMPSSGIPVAEASARLQRSPQLSTAAVAGSLDTSYVCVVDRFGNAFSATPSDISADTPVIPGTGLCISSRGSQAWTDPNHPSCVAPGKRPRLTPNPAMAIVPRKKLMPFGTPGGDVQCQAMLQVFLNTTVFGMNPQQAVEAPRFASYSFPDSFWPHIYLPGRLQIEGRIARETAASLAHLGHDVADWPDWTWKAGGVCVIDADIGTGVMRAGADPRRPSYALGW
jgi:gamma-glutamyltranspeptidase / glutathione hydrolase